MKLGLLLGLGAVSRQGVLFAAARLQDFFSRVTVWQGVLLAIAFVICVLLCYRLSRPLIDPDFKLKGALSQEKLAFMITSLASKSKKPDPHGNGLSLTLIQRYLKRAYRVISAKAAAGEECLEFEHWLYDNMYRLNETLRLLKKQRNVFFSLPHVDGVPRIYELAELIVKSCEGFVTDEIVEHAVSVYNAVAPLTYGEITHFKLMLSYALLEYLAIFAAKCVRIQGMIRQGISDAERKRPAFQFLRYNSYVYGYSLACERDDKRRINELCLDNGNDLYARIDNFFTVTAKYNGFVQAAVTSLQRLPYWFTDTFTLSLSPLYERLAESEQANFERLTPATKSLYLYRIAKKARAKRRGEEAVCRDALTAAAAQKKDVSFFILPPPHKKTVAFFYVLSVPVIAAALAVFTAFFVRGTVALYVTLGVPIFMLAAYIVVMEIAKVAVRSRELPACDLKALSPDSCRTMIVVPRLVASEAEIDNAFHNLETLICANFDAVFSYGLLLDFPSSSQGETESYDETFFARIQKNYDTVGEKSRVSVLVRRRVKVDGEDKYQGYEKKRGALLDLNRAILTRNTDGFARVYGKLESVPYVITLDSDTVLNSCRRLVEIMAHPYNQSAAVATIQMKIDPADAAATGFTRLFAGGKGLNNYSNYLLEVENDLFGRGNYTGKGIYRVADFTERVENAFPDNRILSHDYIEGAYAGCVATNVYALDGFPKTYAKFLTRELRWLRGDWQLLPYLFPFVKNKKGERVKNKVSGVGRWHIFCNMLFSCLPVASMALLLYALFVPAYVLPMVLLAFAVPMLHVLLALRSIFFHPKQFLSELARQLFVVALLPTVAVYVLTAVVVTLIRLVRGKKLLEWQVFAHSGASITFLPNAVAAVVFTASALLFRLNGFFLGLSVLFLFGILFNRLLGLPARREKPQDEAFSARLKALAADTFAYFRAQENPEYHFLPCDNYQEQNGKGWAARTSPTNIGMYLLSYASALEMKLIQKDAFYSAVDNVISSVEALEKWRGNLFNWTDVTTLKTMEPRYVSLVDSGNFLACLLAVSAYTDGTLRARIDKLIEDTDLGALYDARRGLFYIGYHENSATFDNNHYDLMGSESSLSYLVAVATHKIGKEAWDNLSRSMVRYRGATLYSWTGGMFEYLMSGLFFRYEDDTMLLRSCKNAVRAQLVYAGERRFPIFGVSESQFNAQDDNGWYRYHAFGVPQIAHSNIPDPTVVAPYASFLALPYAPSAVAQNFDKLCEEGMYGKYGFYEAYDVESGTPIRSYMTHHQGMLLAAVADFVTGGALKRAFASLPAMRAAAILLTESDRPKAKRKVKPAKALKNSVSLPVTVSGRTETPYVNLLSNGRYFVVNDSLGHGYSLFDGRMITYFDGNGRGVAVSASVNGKTQEFLSGTFIAEQISSRYENQTPELSTVCEITVLPMLDGQALRAQAVNMGDEPVSVEFSVLAELSLNRFDAELAHPAYSKLFVETGLDESGRFLWARRTREKPFFAGLIVLCGEDVQYVTDRARWFGRAGGEDIVSRPLDPVFGAKFSRALMPKEKTEFIVALLCTQDYERMKYVMKLISVPGFLERNSGSNFALSKYRNIGRGAKLTAAKLLYGSAGRLPSYVPQVSLNYARPLICLTVENQNGVERLSRQLSELKALYDFGLSFNLVILYKEKYNYYLHLTDSVQTAVRDSGIERALNGDSTLQILNYTQSPKLRQKLEENAIGLDETDFRILADFEKTESVLPYPNATAEPFAVTTPMGLGGFTADFSYAMDLSTQDTPAPWSNIIAGAGFGTLITESGGGYTFADNARESKLSVWRNDPVLDEPSEFLVLGEKNLVWSVTKKPAPAPSHYYALHSFGFSEFRNDYNGLVSTQRMFIDHGGETKFYELILENATGESREIDVLFAVEAVIGDFLFHTKSALRFSKSDNHTAFVTNALKNLTAFVHTSEPIDSHAFHREAFMDERGRVRKTANLTDEGSAPFLAVSCKARLSPKEKRRLLFSLGTDGHVDFSRAEEIRRTAAEYYANLARVQIDGGDALAALYKWLPYQVLCSRFYGRTGYYQSSGAFGFRDQLQDCLALVYVNPKLVREHLLECAAHQFEKGDVQHWWHSPAYGVRTHFCDDRLFLPYVVAEYVRFTHDYEFIAERVPFLSDVTLTPEDASVYAAPSFTAHRASMLEHCIRAIDVSLDFGENGLVLMRGGDWNDAMDKVGEKGFGTSVWASMFLYFVLKKFLPFINDKELRNKYASVCDGLYAAVDRAWDGDRFLRAITDDGTVLGARSSAACQIDLLSQSWATIAEIGDPEKRKIALATASAMLVDRENKLIRLLRPSFTPDEKIGYIGDYPQGVRENGGQYTHAAVWYAMALFRMQKPDEAYEALELLNPIEKSRTLEDAHKYRVEPYVLAGDVYAEEKAGRGGWSWYTGSAAWMYKCITEELLGVRIEGKTVRFAPNLPQKISAVNLHIHTEFGNIAVEIKNSAKDAPWHVQVGGVTYNTDGFTVSSALTGKKITVMK